MPKERKLKTKHTIHADRPHNQTKHTIYAEHDDRPGKSARGVLEISAAAFAGKYIHTKKPSGTL